MISNRGGLQRGARASKIETRLARAPIRADSSPDFTESYAMTRIPLLLAVCFVSALASTAPAAEKAGAAEIAVAPTDWPWWRGPNHDGTAGADQSPPLKWSDSENVLWKVPVPGRGHGSPTICGDRVFLATAENEPGTQSVICFDRRTGKERWKTVVHRGGVSTVGLKAHAKSSMASSTVACDGERVFVNFLNDGAIYTTALDLNGGQIWQEKVSDYILHQGFGSSPAPYGPLVIVSADNKGGGAIAGLDRATGKVVWKSERPKTPNYASPIILNIGGRDQALFTGCNLVSSFEPLTGKKLWEVAGATTECVTSTVTDGERVFTSGGYPKNHVAAIKADGSGTVAWEQNVRLYVPSLLVKDGYLYAVSDAGVAMCWKSDTGEKVWTHRLGGTFSASPVLVGELIFATNEAGRTTIFKANPKEFEQVAENSLGDEVIATPTICGSRIYFRVANRNDEERQEMLYCLGQAGKQGS
jgi:outer membrane protein assembly factor BamB